MNPGRLVVACALALLAACGGGQAGPTPSTDTSRLQLRTFTLVPESPVACPAYAVQDPVQGTLAGSPDDPERVWLAGATGRISLVWPQGFTVAFEPSAILYDADGHVFAHAGDEVWLGQVAVGSHAGTPADPYYAAGLFDATWANGSGGAQVCAPAANGEPRPPG